MTRRVLAHSAGALLALAGCRASPPAAPPPAQVLEHAWRIHAAADPLEIERVLAPLGADGPAPPDVRFWASWMLARAHALAALRARDVTAELAAAGHPRSQHEVAALYHARAALHDLDAAQAAGRTELPLELAGCDAADAGAGLELLEVGLLERLGFEERATRLLEQRPGLLDPLAVAALLERGRIEPRLGAPIWLALFQRHQREDDAAAFACASRALAASDLSPGALEPADVARLERWIRSGARLRFRCPDCGQEAVPELRACPNDHTPLERFVPAPKQASALGPRLETELALVPGRRMAAC